MAYEVFKRTAVRVEQPALSIAPDGRIVINAAGARVLIDAGVKSALLLWDKTSLKLAIKAAPKDDKNAFAVSIVKGRYSGSIRAKSFLNHIGWIPFGREMLPATWNEKDKMLEVTLPGEYVGSEKDGNHKSKMKSGS
jgi:hypothetical protein